MPLFQNWFRCHKMREHRLFTEHGQRVGGKVHFPITMPYLPVWNDEAKLKQFVVVRGLPGFVL